jgi:integrase
MTLAEAWPLFVAHREADGLKVASQTAYRTLHNRLTAFATHRGYRYLDQWTIADIDRFRAAWKGAPRSQRGRLFLLRAFWRFAVSREWITKSPVADLKMPKGATTVAMKWPFTDAELERMLAACATLIVRHDTRLRGGVWSGDDLLDFIYLLVYTGLRISDATFFDMKNLQGDQVFLRAQKNGGEVFAYIPDWLATRLHARAERLGPRPFLVGVSTDSKTATELWRVRLQKVWAAAGPFDHPPTPHRFRHTFVRILLQKGVTPADVAELIGDNEQTVRRHYARWVPERQARLTKILKEAFRGQATPKKFAVVPGGRR